MMNRDGEWFSRISTCSSIASSSSHDDALKWGLVLRAMTLTSLAPRRCAVRQQSMAVFPTPITSTRSPQVSMCPKRTDSSHSMPMWICCESHRPGRFSSFPLGAPEPMKNAS